MITRRAALAASAAAFAIGGAATARPAPPAGFARREGMALTLDGRPYRFVGANLWYAAWIGGQPRLGRELDRLAGLGVTNLRIAASAEQSPLKNSVRPAFRDETGAYDERLLTGLDHAVAEIGRRGMKSVLYLTNFWEWSGGMATYLLWTNGGRYIDMNDPAHPWPEFPDFVAGFYGSEAAIALYHDHVRRIIGRVNSVTGVAYADDPAIMGWQLANEPRPGGSDAVGDRTLADFHGWIGSTAKLIRSLAPHQLISTGGEGLKGSLEREALVVSSQAFDEIDYTTAHVWPGNWGWLNRTDMAGTHARAMEQSADYVARHVELARRLGKPLVVEEFGYPRDGDRYGGDVPTTMRDAFYTMVHGAVLASAREGGPLAGSNFWAWNGEGRAAHPDARFRIGDDAFLGDPPHEPQGWYGVFDSDASTLERIRAHAAELARV
ncbi:mannan endo-1,4-beta-mannosidase [Brevundimonas alba]|uniref:mannan endo-1,4-beta-mannosidase n=1 Tax=Brevundimonas alba TaxID=74314 RepID=A0A7X5YLM4_9CAUL|nr:cellulase family glycosylhydrolase [Brevundimonas alba]NJC41897.1 mannan endo-1,4-beta-mannosidase [Brevundimonas alba]